MDIDYELARLVTLSPAELRSCWAELTGAVVPNISPNLLRLALAWELQARTYGGHRREVTRMLDQFERELMRTVRPSPGMRLVREWQGRAHVVTVDENQVIHWDNREWRSLSEVARAITGARWSGAAFFGINSKAAA